MLSAVSASRPEFARVGHPCSSSLSRPSTEKATIRIRLLSLAMKTNVQPVMTNVTRMHPAPMNAKDTHANATLAIRATVKLVRKTVMSISVLTPTPCGREEVRAR